MPDQHFLRYLDRPFVKHEEQDLEQMMNGPQTNEPLHGVTLEEIVVSLVKHYDWDELGERINIRCFTSDPSIKSSLKFLRKTAWARKKVEELYLATRNRERSQGRQG